MNRATLRLRAAGLVAAISMTAVLAACSTGASDSAADGTAGSSADVGGSDGGGSDAAQDVAPESAAGGSAADRSGAKAASPSGAVDQGADGPTTEAMERAVVSTGSVSLTSKDVQTARQDVQRVVDAQGGDVTEEDTRSGDGGDTAYARLVVRVPSTKFGATMEALEQVATLRTSTRGSDDVTTQVIDTGVRVRAQEASLKRVELLLAEARDLKDVIWIESQLTTRQAELDSLRSQQSYLRDQTSLSTITVDISTPATAEEPPADRPAGFLAGLRGGLGALGATATTVATVVGALLPFGVLLAVVGGPLWLVLRRRRSAPVPPPTA